MRRCPRCGLDKPTEEFYRSSERGTSTYCASCERARSAAWRARNPERARESSRSYVRRNGAARRATKLRSLYGISAGYYDLLLERQGGGCAVCGARTGGRSEYLSVDHDHETGAVRGLLCESCNHLLGQAADDPGRLVAAALYLTGAALTPQPEQVTG